LIKKRKRPGNREKRRDVIAEGHTSSSRVPKGSKARRDPPKGQSLLAKGDTPHTL
jgi:hypothetical protein